MGKFLAVLLWAALFFAGLVRAESWEVTSPTQAQTFAYGSERSRQWVAEGNHLAIMMHFTNDPYVDQISTRQFDDFLFDFPTLTLGKDRRTFFYHLPGGRLVPVAVAHSGFLGTGLKLLPSNYLAVSKSHGLLTLTLIISDSSRVAAGDD